MSIHLYNNDILYHTKLLVKIYEKMYKNIFWKQIINCVTVTGPTEIHHKINLKAKVTELSPFKTSPENMSTVKKHKMYK